MTLKSTKFKDCSIVAVSAASSDESSPIGISNLIDTLLVLAFIPNRDSKGPLLFAVDHCFAIKGQGTVMTGTVLQGRVNTNDVRSSLINHAKPSPFIKQPISIVW